MTLHVKNINAEPGNVACLVRRASHTEVHIDTGSKLTNRNFVTHLCLSHIARNITLSDFIQSLTDQLNDPSLRRITVYGLETNCSRPAVDCIQVRSK